MDSPRAMHAVALAISRRPLATLVVLLLALTPLLVASAGIRPNNSLSAWFVAGDPALESYERFLGEYGSDEAILVGFPTPGGAYGAGELALQRSIAARIRAVDGVERVMAGGDLPPALARGLVAANGRTAAVVAWMSVRPDLEQVRGRIIADVRDAAEAELGPLGREPHLAGNGVLYEGLNRQTIRDTAVFLSLALLAMTVLLALGLGRLQLVMLALVAPLLSAGAGLGVLGLSGRPFTVVGSALPTLILVIALADAIHVLLHYEEVRRADPPADAAARRRQVAAAVSWVAMPCLFTSVTTAGGFLALATSRIALVRDFGLFAAAGMLLAWVITLAFLAAALALWDARPPARAPMMRPVRRVLEWIAANLPRLRVPVIAAFLVAAVLLGVGALRVEADTSTIGLLPTGHEVRRDSEWLERRLGAYTPLEMRVTNSGGRDDVRFAAQLRTWRQHAEAVPLVTRTFSADDLGPPAPAALRDSYRSADGQSVRVTAYVPMMSAKGLAAAADALEREGERVFGHAGAVEATGYLPLYVRITEYVVQSTVAGLGVAFIVVIVLMALLIRTPRGLLAAVPVNVIPVLLVFGVMGWAGIPLDIATATVGAIVLGIVVDDTIHFLHRYNHARRAGRSSPDAAARSVREAGMSLVLTSAVLGTGFAVMVAAGTRAIAYFGLVAALAVAGALLADLLLLPVLLTGGRTTRTDGLQSAPLPAETTNGQ